MAIFRECKHSFQIVQALFGKSASTVVCSPSVGFRQQQRYYFDADVVVQTFPDV